MTSLSSRKRTISAPRRALGVLVVCWLNLVIAPCAMAFQVVDESPQPASHSDHSEHRDMQAMACCDTDTAQADCCDFSDASTPSRTDNFEIQPSAFSASLGHEWPTLLMLESSCYVRIPPDPGEHSPPLHKIFCVYLD